MTTEAIAAVEPPIRVESREGVATLTLNRGERFNPLSSAMIAALAARARCDRRATTLPRGGARGRGPRLLRRPRSQGDARARGRRRLAAPALRRLQPDDDCGSPPAPAGDRARARHRHRRRMPARVDVRPRRRRRHRDLRAARREHRRVLLHARGGRRAQRRPEARDGAAAHRCSPSTRTPRSPGGWSTASSPLARAGRRDPHSLPIRLSRAARRRSVWASELLQQIERPLDGRLRRGQRDDDLQHVAEDAAEGIDAFLQKRPPSWRDR